jgi:3-oxoacyl-[acyl-carrier protein] reductase
MFRTDALKGRTAIVTGSGRNLGKAIAMRFAEAGAAVVVNGHSNREAVDKVVQEITAKGGTAHGIMADVSVAADVRRLVEETYARFGGIDIAVSNVAVRKKQNFLEISEEDWDRTLRTNLTSAFYLDRYVVPYMKEKGWGRIIHISGVDGFTVNVTTRAHNIVCKAGVHALARALALEFGPFGITANTVAPGFMDTERDWSQYWPTHNEDAIKEIPLGRLGQPDDVAAACLYLASDAGAFVSGAVIHVNGAQARFSS